MTGRFSRRGILAAALVLPAAVAASEIPPDVRKAEGPLGPIAAGRTDAPLTVVEYASTTCEHCAAFHVDTFDSLYRRYVATGLVRWEIRDFPMDALAAAGFVAARCSSNPIAMLSGLYRVQKEWTGAPDPESALRKVAARGGVPADRLERCLSDQKTLDGVNASYDEARRLGVDATPTFFVGSVKIVGNAPHSVFVDRIEQQLGAAPR